MTPDASIEVTKTYSIIDNGNGVTGVGDIIKFTITVENTGNTSLTGLSILDTITDGDSNVVSMTDGPYFISSTRSSTQGELVINETATYIAFYTVTSQTFASGSVINTVSATASSPGNTNDVTDVSDNGIDNDGDTTGDPTVVIVNQTASLNVVKTFTVYDGVADGIVGAGDTINYTITVENNGTSVLTSMTLVDTISSGNGGVLSLTCLLYTSPSPRDS